MPEEQQVASGRSSMGQVFDRIHKVEAEVGEVREQIAVLSSNMTSQGQTLSRIAMQLEQRSATDWKAIWSAASVVLALIALGATLILQPIRQQIESALSAVADLGEYRMIEARAALQDAREAEREAEERGRYRERIDRIDRELLKLRGGKVDE